MGRIESLPPHSPEAERAVLGSILLNQDMRYRIAPIVRADDFHDRRYQLVYQAMLDLDGTPPDILAVYELLEERGQLDTVGVTTLSMTVNATPTHAHGEYYAAIVAKLAQRRRLMVAAGKIAQAAYDTDGCDDPLSFAHKELLDISQRQAGNVMHVKDAADALYNQVEAWANDPLPFGQVRGLSTGITDLDNLVEGLEAGDLVLMAARPSVGKSALVFEIARRVATAGGRVVVFSLEMTADKILLRWTSALSGVNSRRIKRGLNPEPGKSSSNYMSEGEFSQVMGAISEISALPYCYIEETPNISGSEIRARALTLAHRCGGLDLVVVDHTGLMRSESTRNENSAQVEGQKSRSMKILAKDLDCPVILAQQLNRGVESRQDKRPLLSDLRNTGEHEENADIVLGLYRDVYYDPAKYAHDEEGGNVMEVMALKNRDGVTGTRKLRYEAALSRFTQYDFMRGA